MVKENEGRVGRSHDFNNFVELTLTYEAGRIGPLAPLDDRGGDGRTG